MKTLILILLSSLISATSMAKSMEIDGLLSRSMLRALISNAGTLQAEEFEHDQKVGSIPVELVLANAISEGAKMSNSCEYVGRSFIVTCVLTIESGADKTELIYGSHKVNHEDAPRINSVVMKTL